MKIRIIPNPASDVTVHLTNGDTLDGEIESIEIHPRFRKRSAVARFAQGQAVTDLDDIVDEFDLTVSGTTGRVNRGTPKAPASVKALIDMTEDERTEAAKGQSTPPSEPAEPDPDDDDEFEEGDGEAEEPEPEED